MTEIDKFKRQTTMIRTMTFREAESKAREMGLEEGVVEFIAEKFYHLHDTAEDKRGAPVHAGTWLTENEAMTACIGSNGRIKTSAGSAEEKLKQLRLFMEGASEEEIMRVWNTFFEE